MEELAKKVLNAIPAPWSYVLGVVTLVLILIPKFIEFTNSWRDSRSDRRHLELEKERLIIKKLLYEIEILKQQHQLKEIEISPATSILTTVKTLAGTDFKQRKENWFLKHPTIGKIILIITQFYLGYIVIISGGITVMAVILPIVAVIASDEVGVGEMIGIIAIGILTYIVAFRLSLLAYKKVNSFRKKLGEIGANNSK